MPELYDLTIAEAAVLIERRDLSPVELTRACMERVEQVEGRLNAFITVLPDSALEDARKAEYAIAKGEYCGPLHGIPIGAKDIFDMAGVRTTAASKVFAERVPSTDAEAVRRLRVAGAVIIGKLNMHEFAYGVTTATSYYGPTHNPWDLQRIPGGSSGGSAAAVAAGECLGALGTDTAASIRLPAALCGIVGLKPTYDLVSRKGVIPLAWSLDHCGPMTRTTLDAALMLGVLADTSADHTDGIGKGVDGLRIGVPRHYFHEATQPAVLRAFDAALQTLTELGARVREVKVPSLSYVYPALAAIIATEALAYHLPLLRENTEDYTTGVRLRLETGLLYTAAHYLQAQRVRTVVIEEMAATFESVDFLAMPTTPFTALELSEQSDLLPETRLLNWYTRPFNLSGHPAISVPCGFDEKGLPIGLQLVGRPFEEGTLLRMAHAYQQQTDWHTRRPGL